MAVDSRRNLLLLSSEQGSICIKRIRRKGKRIAVVWLVGEIGVIGVALGYHIYGNPILPELPTWMFGIGSFIVGGGAWRAFFEGQSPFEQELRANLQEIEIKIILRKRGAE